MNYVRNIKIIINLIACIILLSNTSYSQQICGTEFDSAMTSRFHDYIQNRAYPPAKKTTNTYYIPIQFHIVTETWGAGGIFASNIYDELCTLNENFDSANMYFYIYDDFHRIHSSGFYNHSLNSGTGSSMMHQHNISNVVNIYIVNTIEGNLSGGGYIGGYFSPSGDGIVIRKNLVGKTQNTLTHEMGHYFNLPHPFNTNNGIEYADGSNCSTAGDRFCDTKADFQNYPWICPYSDDELDPMGTPYDPDPTLFMSYAADACTERFSNEQIASMSNYLTTFRPEHLNYPTPNTTEPETTPNLNMPLSEETNLPYNIKFEWSHIPEAEHYNLLVSENVAFTLPIHDIITSDTFFIGTCLPDQRHYWKIKPLVSGNTCAEYSPYRRFYTNDEAGNLVNISMQNDITAKVYPNPINYGETVKVTSNKKITSIAIYDLQGRLMHTDWEHSSQTYSIATNNIISSGLYLLEITTENGKLFKRISIL